MQQAGVCVGEKVTVGGFSRWSGKRLRVERVYRDGRQMRCDLWYRGEIVVRGIPSGLVRRVSS